QSCLLTRSIRSTGHANSLSVRRRKNPQNPCDLGVLAVSGLRGSPARYKSALVGFGQAVLERVELILDARGQLLADELEPLLDLRQLFTALRDVCDEQMCVC